MPASVRCGRTGRDHDAQGQHVGRGVVQIVAAGHADRLQGRAERARAAEQQRGPQAAHRIPAREDHQRDRHQALAAGQALVPAARVEQRQVGAAHAGEEAARGGGDHAHAVDVQAHGARRLAALADHAQHHAPARAAQAPPQQRRERGADQEQRVDLERGVDLLVRAPEAEVDRRQARCARLDQRLAEEERQAGAEQHQRDADGDVVDPRQRAQPRVDDAEQHAGRAGGQHAHPRRAAEQRGAVADHRAHHQGAFQSQVDAPALLGQALAEADEQERRRDADRAGGHRHRHADPAERGVNHGWPPARWPRVRRAPRAGPPAPARAAVRPPAALARPPRARRGTRRSGRTASRWRGWR